MRKSLSLEQLFYDKQLPRLLYLSLSFCRLENLDILYVGKVSTVRGFICANLRVLNVSNNQLTKLPSVLPVPELIVAYNQIDNASNVKCRMIDVSYNKIKTCKQLPQA